VVLERELVRLEGLLCSFPVGSEVPRIKAETDLAYQNRLLREVETRLRGYEENKGKHD